MQRRYHVAMAPLQTQNDPPEADSKGVVPRAKSAMRLQSSRAREGFYKFSEIPDTKEVRALIAKVGDLISILDGPDILFPREKSTLGEERIRDAVEAVRARGEKRRTRSAADREGDSDYETNVFINCPFDDEYTPIFEAIVFHDSGMRLQCNVRPVALNSSDVRLQKILEHHRLTAATRFTTSRAQSSTTARYRGSTCRWNSDRLGCRAYGGRPERKSFLIFDRDRFRFQNIRLRHRRSGHRQPSKGIRTRADRSRSRLAPHRSRARQWHPRRQDDAVEVCRLP